MRTKRRHIPHAEKAEVVANLARGRNAAVRVLTVSKIGGPEYRAASEVLEAIDKLGEVIRETEC